jgi:transcriptional regulator with XRE-family HTH domain
MKNKPSKPIINLILTVMKDKGINTSALAKKVGIEKRLLKNILRGEEVLTVDHLMLISSAIELNEEYLTQLNFLPTEETEVEKPNFVQPQGVWEPDPNGIHAQQLIQLGFALGSDILFTAQTNALEGFGIPKQILQQPNYQPKIPIRLDAAYHQYYRPSYTEEGLNIRLSFDDVYDCFFPWFTIDRVTFFVEETEPTPSETPTKESAPFLRIIK